MAAVSSLLFPMASLAQTRAAPPARRASSPRTPARAQAQAPPPAQTGGWKVTEVVRMTGPGADASFRGSPDVAVGAEGDFYVLDGRAKSLYRFDDKGTLLWQTEVATQPNPIRAMLRDTAGLRQMASMFINDTGMIAAMTRDTSAAARKRQEGLASLAGSMNVDPGTTMERVDRLAENGIIGKVITLTSGEVAVTDMIGRQTSVFDSTGSFLRNDGTYSMMETPQQFAGLGSRVVAATQSMADMVSGFMNGGKSESSFAIRMMPGRSFAGREIMRMQMPQMVTFNGTTMRMRTDPPVVLLKSSGDRLFVASNEHYSITMYDEDGQKVGTVGRRVSRKPLTPADRMRTTREFAHMMDSMPPAMRERIRMQPEMGDSLPAIVDLAAGDSLVFVQRGAIVSRDAAPLPARMSRWDVIGWDNTYRGYIDMPAGSTIVGARNGKLYGKQSASGTSPASIVIWSFAAMAVKPR